MAVDAVKSIRMKLELYGYKRGRNVMEFSPVLMQVFGSLYGAPDKSMIRGFKCATKDIVPQAKAILDKYFTMHDVSYVSEEGFTGILSKYADPTTGSIDASRLNELAEEIEAAHKVVSPFELPIKLVKGHSFFGQTRKPIALVDDKDFLAKHPVGFAYVVLGDNITLLSVATYVHELVHSQLESIKGSCTNFHNREVLSIFMEKFVACELDPSGELLRVSEYMRNKDLLENIALLKLGAPEVSRDQLLESTVYVTSALKADELFNKYRNGSEEVRTSILSGIQNIFDGSSTVEEFLDDTGISFEDSAKAFCFRKRFAKK